MDKMVERARAKDELALPVIGTIFLVGEQAKRVRHSLRYVQSRIAIYILIAWLNVVPSENVYR